MILDTQGKSLEIAIAAAIISLPITWVVEYSDGNGSHTEDGSVTGTTPVTMIAASALVRTVLAVSIYNQDGASSIITAYLNNNGTRRIVYRIALAAAENLQYNSTRGWYVVDASGNVRGIVPLPLGAATEATLASVRTNVAPLVASTAGGYVRQDSTATISKETGGNLDLLLASQQTRNTLLAAILAQLNVLAPAFNAPVVTA